MILRLIGWLLLPVFLASSTAWAAEKKAALPKATKTKPAKKKEVKKASPDAGAPVEPEEPDEAPVPDDGLPGIGVKAPGFVLKDSNGVYHRLSDSEGNVLVLVFFRTDCEPCLLVMQKVVGFYLAYRDEVDLLAVALLEQTNGRERLDEYLERSRLPFPVLVDADDEIAQEYIMKGNAATLPALFFIDEEGVITQRLHRLSMSLDSYLDEE